MKKEIALWKHGMNWQIRVGGEEFSHRPISLEKAEGVGEWNKGLPPHVSTEEVMRVVEVTIHSRGGS